MAVAGAHHERTDTRQGVPAWHCQGSEEEGNLNTDARRIDICVRRAEISGERAVCSNGGKMTLIACLHPCQCRTVVADVLVSSKLPPITDLVLPLRAYIPPERIRMMPRQPVALRRKIFEISNDLVALWSGALAEAFKFAERATVWFQGAAVTEESIVGFLDTFYREPVPDFQVIIVPLTASYFYKIGKVQSGTSPLVGEYMVAGSGASLFVEMIGMWSELAGNMRAPDVYTLRMVSDFMARELGPAVEPIQAGFGGAYEILYHGLHGFQRVDDVMHLFTSVQITADVGRVHLYPHVTRQWYEGDQLCIASYSTREAHQQGIESTVISVPSLLATATRQSTRTGDSLCTRPNYVCIHHLLGREGRLIPLVLTIRGDTIDSYFSISRVGSDLMIEPTDAYGAFAAEQLMAVWQKLRLG